MITSTNGYLEDEHGGMADFTRELRAAEDKVELMRFQLWLYCHASICTMDGDAEAGDG